MALREKLVPGEFYHLYNRGTEKRKIFLSKRDHERFLALLFLSNSKDPSRLDNLTRSEQGSTLLTRALKIERGETLIDIAAYWLMPNHFHLLVREKEEGGISRFMQKLSTGYTMYFNKKYERSGTLLQGKFKSSHAGEDRYLRYLISYIHLNPVKLIEPKWKEIGIRDKKKASDFLEEYNYSSFLDFCKQERAEAAIITPGALPDYFDSPADFKQSLTEWLIEQNEQGSTLLKGFGNINR